MLQQLLLHDYIVRKDYLKTQLSPIIRPSIVTRDAHIAAMHAFICDICESI